MIHLNKEIFHNKYVPIFFLLAVATSLVIFGNSFVLQRGRDFGLSLDNTIYIYMIEHGYSTVHAPFKYRILVPFIASGLALSPIEALKAISLSSLLLCYFLLLLICRRLGFSIGKSICGVLMAFGTVSHVLNYQNLLMTDAFQLFIVVLAIYAIIDDRFTIFMLTVAIGILARETTIFLAPAWWLAKNRRQGFMVISVGLITFLIPRLIMDNNESEQIAGLFDSLRVAYAQHSNVKFSRIIQGGFISYGPTWIIAAFGMFALHESVYVHKIYIVFAMLFAGAFITSFIASDVERMWMILFPVMAIGSAAFFSKIINYRKRFGRICSTCIMLIFLPLVVLSSDNMLMHGTIRQGYADFRIGFIFVMSAISLLLGLMWLKKYDYGPVGKVRQMLR